jgi:hypothetical protein
MWGIPRNSQKFQISKNNKAAMCFVGYFFLLDRTQTMLDFKCPSELWMPIKMQTDLSLMEYGVP